jgi:hypothetical protein
MLGLAIRIAQRMGIDSEVGNSECEALEAEMRRRLWWALVLFDNRISEISAFHPVMMASDWDCKKPANVSDVGLLSAVKKGPAAAPGYTEAIFAVVRSEIADFIRQTEFREKRSLQGLASKTQPKVPHGDADGLYMMLFRDYLQHGDEHDPLQYMSVWYARGTIAKYTLTSYNTKFSQPNAPPPTQKQRDDALDAAMDMLEADSRLMTADLAAGQRWFTQFHFPMPAYIRITRELQKRPELARARRCWMRMNENYQARFQPEQQEGGDGPLFRLFSTFVLAAWEAREGWVRSQGGEGEGEEPWMVVDIRLRLAQAEQDAGEEGVEDVDEFGLTRGPEGSAGGLLRLMDVQGWGVADVPIGDVLDPRLVCMLEWNTMHGR